MIPRWLGWLLAGFGLLLLQVAVLPDLGSGAWVPDLFLVATALVAFRRGPRRGQTTGFLAGALQDLFSAMPLGFHAFTRTLVGFGIGLTSRFFAQGNPLALALVVAAATLVELVLGAALGIAFGLAPVPFVWPRALTNALVAVLADLLRRRFAPPAAVRLP